MKFKNYAILIWLLLFVSLANGQRTEVTISFSEQFFDALLDAVFQHSTPPEFPLAQKEVNGRDAEARSFTNSFSASPRLGGKIPACNESIKLLRETNGIRTAVRFREGKIYAPMAFSGSYNPPFIGCVEFGGWAETNIDLEFDQNGQRLIARARVTNVSLNGTGGVGGSVVARLVQNSIDKKINPIEILRLDKVSFAVPIQNSANIRMKATGVRHSIENGVLHVHIAYEFVKA